MLQRTVTIAITALLALALCACGSSGGDQSSSSGSQNENNTSAESSATSESQTAEYDPMVDTIDLTLDKGTIRYDHFEKANDGLTDKKNVLVFVFDFTNAQTTPAQCQSAFRIQFFQNGSELDGNCTYSSTGGEQYELVGAFMNEALKDGTVRFGRIVIPKDSSPITVMVSPNGSALEDNYQTMEVAIDGADPKSQATSSDASGSLSAETIDAALQGSWETEGTEKGVFTFDQGSLNVSGSGANLSGTYEVDTESSSVKCHLEATDGTVNVTIPYEYDGANLKLFNSQGAEMTKM